MRYSATLAAAVAAAISAGQASGAVLYWQDASTGSLDAANYYNATTATANTAPNTTTTSNTTGDYVFLGAGGTGTIGTGQSFSLARLRVGHNDPGGGASGPVGSGTVEMTGGTLNLGGLSGSAGSAGGLIIGFNADGEFNASGDSDITIARNVRVGYDYQSDSVTGTGTGSLNLSGNASLTVSANNLSIGEYNPGNVTLSDNASLSILNGANGTINIGWTSTATFTQTGGSTSVNYDAYVGRNATPDASLSISGGTFSAGSLSLAADAATNTSASLSGSAALTTSVLTNTNGDVLVAGDSGSSATNTSFSVSDTATASIANNLIVGNGTAADTSFQQSGGTVTVANEVFVGRSSSSGTSMSLSNGAKLSAFRMTVADGSATNTSLSVSGADTELTTTGNLWIGRANSSNTTFTMTDGTINAGNFLLFGTGDGTAGNQSQGVVATQSGGTINSVSNFTVGNLNSDVEYYFQGGTIDTDGRLLVGRQTSTALFRQTGGDAIAGHGVRIGDDQATDPVVDPAIGSTGVYEISGGSITATVPDGSVDDALAIAPRGVGTLLVIGDDASIDILGNAAAYNTAGGAGTLAYQLETGESLSLINVTGNATFAAGSILSFDLAGVTPTQTAYDLLTAVDIVDNGISFSGPSGWEYQIVSGGNGEILRVAAVPEPGGIMLFAAAGMLALGRRRRASARQMSQ